MLTFNREWAERSFNTNRGTKDTSILEQGQVVDITVAPRAKTDPRLLRLHGSTSAGQDWLPIEENLLPGMPVEFGPIVEQANSSSGACPFFNLQWAGGGVLTAIGWTAPWRAKVERDRDDVLRLKAGMQYMHLGDFYPLVPVTMSEGDWCALQYHLPETQEGMALVFRRHAAPVCELPLALRDRSNG